MVIEFYSNNSHYCDLISCEVRELFNPNVVPDATFLKANIHQNKWAVGLYHVTGVPTFMLLQGNLQGNFVWRGNDLYYLKACLKKYADYIWLDVDQDACH